MLQKLSKCEVKVALFGNFTICLPSKLYMKSNSVEFKCHKMSFLALLETLNFNFSKFEPFLKSKNYQKSKFRISKIVKMAIFDIQILQKLILSKIV